MSVNQYGIYVVYPPTVDLTAQGLGRYLAAFLKGASERDDVRFVIICPSWSVDAIHALLDAEGVPRSHLQIVSPKGKPYLLRAYELVRAFWQRRPSLGILIRAKRAVERTFARLTQGVIQRVARARTLLDLAGLLVWLLPCLLLAVVALPLALVSAVAVGGLLLWRSATVRASSKVQRVLALYARATAVLVKPQDSGLVLRLFTAMHDAETERMERLIGKMTDVRAWYCPTAFWTAFNRIDAPRLMCVPDVVLMDFPVAFASLGGTRVLDTFEDIQGAIRAADHLVTYSGAVKAQTLVDRLGVATDRVHVVPHAPNSLDKWVAVTGFPDNEETSRRYCGSLLLGALANKSNRADYTAGFANRELKFLFYASQFRPNKNVLSLLRAYEFLLRDQGLGLKLLLTGDVAALPEVAHFIGEHRLANDVICLKGLSVSELAACYKLATLAVNPSLSEGGCPFTFTEALSVGTPVVMARISVSEEVLDDPALQAVTFFDPYDWKDMAQRIRFGVAHRDQLLAVQSPAYERLAQRTWRDVVDEHIDILDRVARQRAGVEVIS
ncbi:glycosyltransferase [Hydrogenophaga sp. OTU3427]|uniref:glycosyltransferase n=1 Tax=Hydrogenophaga sp. OTU3427 TaxID=3043856 RepID=UPI00313DFC81